MQSLKLDKSFMTHSQIHFLEEPEKFTLDDGLRGPLMMSSKQRELLGAVFYSHVLHSVGVFITVYFLIAFILESLLQNEG